ncbi:hypothetical protein [Heyndrickxia camelliae]|uniref:Uncharacterized protein n=1 Tax=Heyndrickxia camelliae TaxID=1707093 RepID=A0A2N3LDA8_9BACI|nr:hypothetical protein [Heyndrickxia camelliae]PKR82576.1 hypothetical protein CWO92_23625 [Heyndrickxia camelliae]
MTNARFKFHYVSGQTEELDTGHRYNKDARQDLALKFHHNATWISAGGKQINLANVISIEVIGDEEEMSLKVNLQSD